MIGPRMDANEREWKTKSAFVCIRVHSWPNSLFAFIRVHSRPIIKVGAGL